jgi:phosphoglycerate dehydrogenase-like enzyme
MCNSQSGIWLRYTKVKMTDSKKVKVLFAISPRTFPDSSLLYAEAEATQERKGISIELSIVDGADEEAVLDAIREVEVFVTPQISRQALRAGRKLKLVQAPFAGVNQLDFSIFREEKRVHLANSHAPSVATAEHAWALILALAKRVVWHDRELRLGRWRGMRTSSPNIELRGQKLAVIGMGAIGREVARIGRAFGMEVYAVKITVTEGDKELLKEVHFLGAGADDLEYVLKECDFAVLCVPLTPSTSGLIGAEELELLAGKYLVNVSRGVVVDEEALFRALKDGNLAGAGIDTWYIYPRDDAETENTMPSRFPFEELPNVVMTPHNGGYSDGFLRENLKFIFSNIARVARGEVPENLVDVEREY